MLGEDITNWPGRAKMVEVVSMSSCPPHRIKPEVMSPAGYWPQLHAAIEAGADSVYFGLTHFTARAKRVSKRPAGSVLIALRWRASVADPLDPPTNMSNLEPVSARLNESM